MGLGSKFKFLHLIYELFNVLLKRLRNRSERMRCRQSHIQHFSPDDHLASDVVAELYSMVLDIAVALASIDLNPHHAVVLLFVVLIAVGMTHLQLMSPASGFTSRLVPFKLFCNDQWMAPMKMNLMDKWREGEI